MFPSEYLHDMEEEEEEEEEFLFHWREEEKYCKEKYRREPR
jgi:hypothetical protein